MTAPEALVYWRIVGSSQIALGLGHLPIWRLLEWRRELRGVTPLTARVFAVHTFFIVFVLVSLGSLELGRPQLLETRSELARLLLAATAIFWAIRFLAQPLVFDPVLLRDSRLRTPIRAAAMFLFASYTLMSAWAFSRQL